MSELSTLAKSFFVLGFVAVLAVLMFQSSGPVLPATMSAPVFNNPFAQAPTFSSFIMIPNSSPNGTFLFEITAPPSTTNPNNATLNCYGQSPAIDWYGCVLDGERNLASGTYLTVNQGNPDFVVGLSRVNGLNGNYSVGSITIFYTCKYFSTQYKVDFDIYDYTRQSITTNVLDMPKCGTTFGLHSFVVNFVAGSYPTIQQFNGGFIGFHSEIADVTSNQSFDYVSVSVNPPVPTNCAGDTVCSINQGFQALLNGAVFIVNIILYIGAWIQFGFSFLTQFFTIIAWLYAIPGMPLLVQGFVSSYITVLFGIIIIAFIKMLRGGSP